MLFGMTKKDGEKNQDTVNKKKLKNPVDCPDCDGKGVNLAVDDHNLCPTCNGSGKVEAS